MRQYLKPAVGTLAALALAYGAGVNSFGNITANSGPDRAVAVQPKHAQAQAALADLLLVAADKDKAKLTEVVTHARAALQVEPGNARALRALALASEQGAVKLDTGRLMQQSSDASRRDLVTQIWLVQRAAREGNPKAAMRHANVAMLANRRGDEVMIPMLVRAMVDDRLVTPLAQELATRPPWLATLWGQILESKPAWPNAVKLLGELKADKGVLPDDLGRELVQRMADNGQYALAAGVFATLAPDRPLGRSGVTSTQFAQEAEIAPFDWQTQANGRIAADALREGGMLFEVSRGPGGLLARRLVPLQPGDYRLRAKLGVEDADAGEVPFVRLTCANPKAASRSFQFTEGSASRILDARVSIAGDCPFQWLEIASPSVDAVDGSVTMLHSISLDRDGGAPAAGKAGATS